MKNQAKAKFYLSSERRPCKISLTGAASFARIAENGGVGNIRKAAARGAAARTSGGSSEELLIVSWPKIDQTHREQESRPLPARAALVSVRSGDLA